MTSWIRKLDRLTALKNKQRLTIAPALSFDDTPTTTLLLRRQGLSLGRGDRQNFL